MIDLDFLKDGTVAEGVNIATNHNTSNLANHLYLANNP